MLLPVSEFLIKSKPDAKKLINSLTAIYPYASILGQDACSMAYQIASTGVSISENADFTNRGFVIRVHNGKSIVEYSVSEISENIIPDILRTIHTLSESAKGDDPLPTDEKACVSEQTELEIDPDSLEPDQIISKLTDLREKCLKKDERILDASIRFVWQKNHRFFLSKNRDLSESLIWSNGAIVSLAAKGEEVKDYYKSFSTLGGAEILNDMAKDEVIDEVTDTVISLLDSVSMEPGEYECICDPETTGMIVHEAFGHGVEMDMFVKDRALAKEYIGKRVASDLVTMHDGAKAAKECASFLFDDEGTLGQDTLVIKNGILISGYSDAVSAGRLGISPTGNGRRESFRRKAYTRMTNTFFEPGTSRFDEMIASVKYGFLLENPSSGMEDPKNWGIQCMVNIAREIKDGRLTGKICSPIVLTGYVPDLLKSISMMSSDFSLGGGGFCGKGYKEWVKVSDGGPYIKARIRLG
ncbi:MAG: TldD/PmbA family protein [Clostridia bacterium]|nr:TldD/PmbA family protein [Clostridia bacterium]MBQ4157666.1 TldD/PmbA family protein [Clostridia bacterium]